ncbi:MAG: hypothetical protein KME46_08450 [Brasilonema angustatum HA4187-MV1]|jgi:hypothetical protein|nr:hypothetical protein [Brasilonema sp. CT11]MBW4592941.1 hypothetical protein [Brasilonema angustatum HA4187-MV1]
MLNQFEKNAQKHFRSSKIQVEIKELAQPLSKNTTAQLNTDADGSDLNTDADGSDLSS